MFFKERESLNDKKLKNYNKKNKIFNLVVLFKLPTSTWWLINCQILRDNFLENKFNKKNNNKFISKFLSLEFLNFLK